MTVKNQQNLEFLSQDAGHDIQFLREQELANRWRVDVGTLQRWRYNNIGPDFIKFPGRVIYAMDKVVAYEQLHLKKMGIGSESDL